MKPYHDNGKGIQIFHGDCRKILPTLPKADLVLTDPPYEVRAGYGGGEFGARSHLVKTGRFTDNGFDISILDQFLNWFCFCSMKQLSRLIQKAEQCPRWNIITWCKPNPVPTVSNKYLPDVEFIIHGFTKGRLFGNYNDKSCFILHCCGQSETDHPNEKPVPIITKLLNLGSLPGEIIIDPFMGSGTTLRAAKDLGRKAIGIEIEEKYCEIAAKRLEQEVLSL
jgi:site-specific DNA-methyltransferase (adenine-specific)